VSEFQILRYDARGTGMSDWEADEISLEAWVQDQSVAVAITYAARHLNVCRN
jgi:hypothetical protein